MSNNPYVDQISQQTGATPEEIQASQRPATRKPLPPGFDSYDEYYQAIHEFLNEN